MIEKDFVIDDSFDFDEAHNQNQTIHNFTKTENNSNSLNNNNLNNNNDEIEQVLNSFNKIDYTAKTLIATVESIIYFNQDEDNPYTIASVKLEGDTSIFNSQTVVASSELNNSTAYEFSGEWIEDPKYGYQFKAHQAKYAMPNFTAEALFKYLMKNKIAGIGEVKAKQLADQEQNLITMLENDDEVLVTQFKLNEAQIKGLQEILIERLDYNNSVLWLYELGLTNRQINNAKTHFASEMQTKSSSVDIKSIIMNNPYELAQVKGIGFVTADKIALQNNFVGVTSTKRIAAAILHLLYESENGNTKLTAGGSYIEYEELERLIIDLLCFNIEESAQLITQAIQQLIDETKIIAEHRNGTSLIGLMSTYVAEKYILQALLKNEQSTLNDNQKATVSSIIAQSKPQLTTEQHKAIITSLENRYSVITGGAGTGKTTTIKTLISVISELYSDSQIRTCTLSGRASQVLELKGVQSKTIHRMLGYSGFQWLYNSDNKLPTTHLIVDETSMLNIHLVYKLLTSISDDCKIIFVGDANQLPPIGAGDFFHDIIKQKTIPATVLTQVQRNAGDLLVNSNAILEKQFCKDTCFSPDGKRVWQFVNTETPQDVLPILKLIYQEKLDAWGYDYKTDVQVVIPQKTTSIGTAEVNTFIQNIIQAEAKKSSPNQKFFIGDRVIWTVNDYQLDLMNGTQGYITDITFDKSSNGKSQIKSVELELIDSFDDDGNIKSVTLKKSELKNLELSYACTVHKLQGSQYKLVIPVIHSSHYYMLNQKLFYTACTRAMESCIIIGNLKGIRAALAENKNYQKNTWIQQFYEVKNEMQEIVDNAKPK